MNAVLCCVEDCSVDESARLLLEVCILVLQFVCIPLYNVGLFLLAVFAIRLCTDKLCGDLKDADTSGVIVELTAAITALTIDIFMLI